MSMSSSQQEVGGSGLQSGRDESSNEQKQNKFSDAESHDFSSRQASSTTGTAVTAQDSKSTVMMNIESKLRSAIAVGKDLNLNFDTQSPEVSSYLKMIQAHSTSYSDQ